MAASPLGKLRDLLAARLVEDCHAIADALLESGLADRILILPQARDGVGCLLLRVGLWGRVVDMVAYPGAPRRQILADLLQEIGESQPKESGS